VDSKAFSSVQIEEVDPEGKFVKLKNRSPDLNVPIGGWIIRNMGTMKEVNFKFNTRQIIGKEKTITVCALVLSCFIELISLHCSPCTSRSGPTTAVMSTHPLPTS
jgi:hypothetical protein